MIEKEQPRHLSFNLGQDAAYDNGLICGGQLDVFVEPVLPVPGAFIFSAGQSLSKVANLATTWLEELMFARQPLTRAARYHSEPRPAVTAIRRTDCPWTFVFSEAKEGRDASPATAD